MPSGKEISPEEAIKLFKEVDKLRQDLNQAIGSLQTLKKELREKFEVEDIESAKAKLAEAQEKANDIRKKIQSGVREFRSRLNERISEEDG